MVPFFAYAALFLILPSAQVMIGAFKSDDGRVHVREHRRHPPDPEPASRLPAEHRDQPRHRLGGGLLGLLIAYAAIREGTPRWIRSAFTTFSGVAANFGGIPLAFAFIATLGHGRDRDPVPTNQLGIDIYANGFSLFTKTGVELAYLYFQIPLMFLVIAPAIDGLRAEWREASANLGSSSFQYWWHIGLPVLLPSLLGAVILLFGNSFAAYATAYGLTASGLNLVPILIGADLRGNVYSNPHEGQALAFGMFAVLAGMMLLYVPLQRRASRWAR